MKIFSLLFSILLLLNACSNPTPSEQASEVSASEQEAQEAVIQYQDASSFAPPAEDNAASDNNEAAASAASY
ncbi:MAG: hypothetical protein Q4E16_02780 [Neisseria sp.]|nr:hypothetical protein [Neisseria sp.]